MNIYHSLTFLVLLFFSIPMASAQISNGSFEDFIGFTDIAFSTEIGDIGVDNVGGASSWNFGPDAGIGVGNTTDGDAAAWLGTRSIGLDAVISQVFLIANTGSYSLGWDSFAENPFFSETINSYNVDVSEVGGASVFNSDFTENALDGLATSHSVPFTATGGAFYTLTFTGLGVSPALADSVGDVFIDNVSVVPEPGSALVTTLAALLLIRHRRR